MDKIKQQIASMALEGKKSKNLTEKRIILNGLITEIILTKVIVDKNPELPKLTNKLINYEFKEYVYKSKTTVISRIARQIEKLTVKELEQTFNNILEALEDEENIESREQRATRKSNRSSTLSTIEKWQRVINNDPS